MSEGREMELRPLHPLDETGLCRVIRSALVEFGADRPGFAWQDPELDAMSKTYAASGWIYLVVAEGENVLGGAGIGPLSGVDAVLLDVLLPEVVSGPLAESCHRPIKGGAA